MLNKEEIQITLQFLDRVSITGHQERMALNTIYAKLVQALQPAPPAEVTPQTQEKKAS